MAFLSADDITDRYAEVAILDRAGDSAAAHMAEDQLLWDVVQTFADKKSKLAVALVEAAEAHEARGETQ